jgi:putative CocE/NonD family hydrolase
MLVVSTHSVRHRDFTRTAETAPRGNSVMIRPRTSFPVFTALIASVILLTRPGLLFAQGLEYVKENYTKYEHQIPMRDGVRLFTSVYVPKDQSQKYPIMLSRTPYSVQPYDPDSYKSDLGPSPLFGKDGYIVVYQDVRGRWMSEGEFVNMRPHRPEKSSPQDIDESSDTYDTIDWLVKNVPGNNGRVGLWGISYPGFYTAAGMIDAHPALKAASPQAPVTDWFTGDDWHHNGAFLLPHAFNFMASFGHPRPKPTKQSRGGFDPGTPDGYEFFLRMGPLSNANTRYLKNDVPFWNEMMQHGTYDEFWKARNLRPHLKSIKPAVMTVGGWFDAENLFGALETYKNVEAHSPGATNVLVMGPWRHGGWGRGDGASLGPISFASKTSDFYREQIEFPFFQYYLKDKGSASFPEAWIFETGTNEWKKYDQWPPRNLKQRSLYLQARGGLSFDPPGDPEPSAADEYVSDPAHPVEYIDQIEFRMTGDYMTQDQRVASRRPDVLAYKGPPLESPITISGPIEARLFVSTSGTDSDWIVKLIDVYPDNYRDLQSDAGGTKLGGFQQLVRGDVMRGKFRNGLDKPEPFVPGSPTPVSFRLPDVEHTFLAGHRIMVQIQSTWFPLIDRNPQKFVDIYSASESDFQKATQRVYRSSKLPSHLEVLEATR